MALLFSLCHRQPPTAADASIPEIFQTLCEELALTRPDDPLAYMAHSFASAQYIDLAAARCTSITDAADPLTYAPPELSISADGTLLSVNGGGFGADGESSSATYLSTPFPSSVPAPYFSRGAANTNATVATHRAESGARPVPAVPTAVTASTPRHANATPSSFSSSASASSASASSPRAVAFGIDLSATLSGNTSGSSGSGSGSTSGDSIGMHTMRALLEANTRIGAALDPYRATEAIVDECCRLCECERATIFLVNETRRELEVWSLENKLGTANAE